MAQGTIRKLKREKGIVWEARYDLGPDPVTGKRRPRGKSFDTRRGAQAFLSAMESEIRNGTAVDRSHQTLGEMLTFWLDTNARPRLRAKTVYDYEQTIRFHIMPELGTIPLQKLTPERIQKFYADKLAAGTGPRTMRLCHLHLNQAIKQAMKLGLVSRNVMALVTQPTDKPKEMSTWTAEQTQQFMTVASESKHGPIWILALAAGMRRGELLGLRWRDVDFDRRVLMVNQTIGSLRGKTEVKPPKTKSSRREVSLQDGMIDALKEHKRRQNEQRLLLGAAWQDHGLVFPSAIGTPINPDNLTRDFHRLIGRAGIPKIRIHDQRHTHVTLALQSGASLKAVSQAIGHADVSTTLRTYAHVSPAQRVEVADKVGAILFAPRVAAQ